MNYSKKLFKKNEVVVPEAYEPLTIEKAMQIIDEAFGGVPAYSETDINVGFVESTKRQQTMKEIIEEIHETFYTEVDRLLEEAGIDHPIAAHDPSLAAKAKRLEKLGFNMTQEVKADREVRHNNLKAETVNYENAQLKAAINYFRMKYPNYKFITEKSVKRICDKYGLVYGAVHRYKGTVPDANLEQIEKFKIKDEDLCYVKQQPRGFTILSSRRGFTAGFDPAMFEQPDTYIGHGEYLKGKAEAEKIKKSASPYQINMLEYYQTYMNTTGCTLCPLEIAAPVKDFDMTGAELNGTKIVNIPDPVVLQPVFFEGTKHYLIVTAWGAEAADELVVNERNN